MAEQNTSSDSEEDTLAEALGDAFKFLETHPPKDRKKYFGADEEDPGKNERKDDREERESAVLDPESPLLAKFQVVLKQHLEHHIARLKAEIYELETGAKKKNVEREQMGVEAYETQQVVSKQQAQLENCISELENISASRLEIDHELQEALAVHRETQEELFAAQKKEIELKNEVESVNLLVQQVSKWEESVENELRLNQRIYDKTKKDKIKLAEEKRQQDMFVYKLMTEVWRLEGELETINMQLRVKESERERLAGIIAASNTEIEAAETEQRCLIQGWNSVVVAISNRDKHYSTVRTELSLLHEKLRNTISEIEQVKKMCGKEMNQNETLTLFKNRIEADIRNNAHQIEAETNKRDALERAMMETQAIVDQLEKDFAKLQVQNNATNLEITQIRRQFEKLTLQKVKLEEDALNKLQDQICNDKAAKYMFKLSQDIKSKNRLLEINLFEVENQNASVIMDIEAQKGINLELQSELDELNKQLDAMDKKMAELEDEINKYKSCMNKKQRDIERLNNKIEFLTMKCGKEEKSPQELKIKTLEQHIDATIEKIKDLQKFWLREQGHVVCLSEQRQEQIHESNLLQKQCMIFEQRNLKINDELAAHKTNEDKMCRNINKLQNQLVSFTEALNKRKGSKMALDEGNDLLQNEFHAKLKDFEFEVVKMDNEIVELEDDIATLSKELLEHNREALEWEKKYQLTVETKRKMDAERSAGGEVGNMKAEIHRMTVRYDQLKKAQQKLILDLQYCISRRDGIVTKAEAQEKRTPGTQLRMILQRRLDNTRNKLRQLQKEIDVHNEKIRDLEEEEREVNEQVSVKELDIEEVTRRNRDILDQIEICKSDKEMELDLLVFKQRKLRMLMDVSKGRKPFLLYKTDDAIQKELGAQIAINRKLLALAEMLMAGYPAHFHALTRIANALKLPSLVA